LEQRYDHQTLLRRAQVLARPLEAASSRGEDMLQFVLGEETFATPLGALREVVTTAMVTAVPGVSPPFIGLANVRGALIAVLDPRALLGVSGTRPAGLHPLLVVAVEGGSVGLWADRVEGLVRVDLEDLDRRPSGALPGLGGRTADLTGVIHLTELIQAARSAAVPNPTDLEA